MLCASDLDQTLDSSAVKWWPERSPAWAVADDSDAVILQIRSKGHGLHVERRLYTNGQPVSTTCTGEQREQEQPR